MRGASNASAAITYTPFDKPRRIEAEHGPTTYEYDGDRQRARKVSPAQSTTYVGGLYERHEHTAGGVAHKMRVMGPEGVIAVVTIAVDAAGNATRSEHYLHPGHDGSAGVITNELGRVVERRSYDPFGQRRNPDWANGGPAAVPPSETIGFTGHEDEEELSLINMRGRVYDPALGRFLSADPFVQAPFFSQSLNRYSYAFNNPLSFVDPTGYQATGENFFDWMDGGAPAGVTYDNCVVGPGCVQVEVGQPGLPGIYNDLASGEPFGHREPGPPGLGLGLSLDLSGLQPGYAPGSRWNPYSSLGQAGRDVIGEERPIADWSLSPEMTRAAMGLMPIPGISSLTVFSDPRATPRDKAIAVALDALSVVGVGAIIKFAGKAAGAPSKAGRAPAPRRWRRRSGLQGEWLPPSGLLERSLAASNALAGAPTLRMYFRRDCRSRACRERASKSRSAKASRRIQTSLAHLPSVVVDIQLFASATPSSTTSGPVACRTRSSSTILAAQTSSVPHL
ncbi:RHS repeat-associated core domain-containing protein [Sorangium sp. So ce321]